MLLLYKTLKLVLKNYVLRRHVPIDNQGGVISWSGRWLSDRVYPDKYSYQAVIQLPRKIEPIKDFHPGSLRSP